MNLKDSRAILKMEMAFYLGLRPLVDSSSKISGACDSSWRGDQADVDLAWVTRCDGVQNHTELAHEPQEPSGFGTP